MKNNNISDIRKHFSEFRCACRYLLINSICECLHMYDRCNVAIVQSFLLFKPSKGGKTRNCGCFENIPININIKI